MNRSSCKHGTVTCLNQHELIRKYRCADCDGVMMCACDEEFGCRFLAHQLDYGVELKTQGRVRVTLGFQIDVCNACRGLPLVPAPAAAIPGRTSKIRRFYWREIFFAETGRMAKWQEANRDASPEETQSVQRVIQKEVLDELKTLHAVSPKYDMSEPSQSEILKRYHVDVEAFYPEYTTSPSKGSVVIWEREVVSPETFAARQYMSLWGGRSCSWRVLHCMPCSA
ncbi:MAG: hypothetical protein ACR2RF_15135 [Geminicoccaceae bacterium]